VSRESCADAGEARRSRAREAVTVATLVGALLWIGCATVRSAQTGVGGWVDRTRGQVTAEGEPRVAYAAVDRLRIHREPAVGSEVTGVLVLHEKISRYQSESGFAYVSAEGGRWGWVAESQLVERIPKRVSRPEAVEPMPEEQPAGSGAAPGPEVPAAEPGEQPEQAVPAPDEKTPEPEPSVFDPY
jgi:hypothetical protein